MLDFNEFELYLIRHGQSAVNVLPDQMGQASDVPLTIKGIQQAKKLRDRLCHSEPTISYVYSSDYNRALHTAEIAMGEDRDRIIVSPALREYSAGEWEGSKRSEVLTAQVALRMGYLNNAFQPPNGESMHQVERRAATWLEDAILYNKDMIAEAKRRRDEGIPKMTIAVFSHGMTIKCLLHYVMGFDGNFTWRIRLNNTSITKLSFDDEGWKLISVNDCSHLM